MARFASGIFRLTHVGFPVWFLLVMSSYGTPLRAAILHHDLHVTLQPGNSHISVVDRVQVPAPLTETEFSLRASLAVKARGADLSVTGQSDDGRLKHYKLSRLPPGGKVQLSYEGRISPGDGREDIAGMPDAVLSEDGLFLDERSAWFPRFSQHPQHTFTLRVDACCGWEFISQGKRQPLEDGYRFDMPQPQDDIYLLGGPYTRYARSRDGVETAVYLLEPDEGLAQRYLDTSADYIRLYSEWIGPYPYAKFAVVENRWQTGYGMPSFTLLGSRVIRLPFILHTSLPHEILHNWWGNGVYVDYSLGNWSEGLTAYLSDHYSSEQQGKGSEYRRKALERYANFAAEQRDFALAGFTSRHDEASQAVGYGKAMMLFHMLHEMSGDDEFSSRLRKLWLRYRFQYASFPEVLLQLHPGPADAFVEFADHWLYQPGAPKLSLEAARVTRDGETFRLSLRVSQLQEAPLYTLAVPLDVKLEGLEQSARRQIELSGRHSEASFAFSRRPVGITLDPEYDVFRLLHPDERPASLGRLFGANSQVLVYPGGANDEQIEAWQKLAETWSRLYRNVTLVSDREFSVVAGDAAVWLLGWQNARLQDHLDRLTMASQQLSATRAVIDGIVYRPLEHAVVLLDPDNRRSPLGFIGAENPAAIASLARKLPHYSTYGTLAFTSPGAGNVLKTHLPVLDSPLSMQLDDPDAQ